MKSRKQKREEAADRLERYADRIEQGAARFGHIDPKELAEMAAKRRKEAARLRSL